MINIVISRAPLCYIELFTDDNTTLAFVLICITRLFMRFVSVKTSFSKLSLNGAIIIHRAITEEEIRKLLLNFYKLTFEKRIRLAVL